MSTITVARRENEVAIAADSLTIANYNRRESANYVTNHGKIIQVGDSFLGLSGPASADFALREYFSQCEQKTELETVEGIYRTWIKLHETLKSDYFLRPYEEDSDCFESTRIDVLIANPFGIFGVPAHRSVQEYSKFFAFGSGEDYALGAMFVAYHDSSKSAEEVARIGVQAAVEFNSATGEPIYSQTVVLREP